MCPGARPSILVSNGFTCWPCTRQNAQMLFTVCRKYRLDPESKKRVQQQNAAEGTRHLVLGILPLLRYSVVAYIHRSLSTYLTMGVVFPKPNRQLPINCTSVNKNWSSVAVNNHLLRLSTNIICCCHKLFNCRRSLNKSNSNKPSLQKWPWKCFKGNYKPTMYFVLGIVCCVSQYCVVTTIKCKFFQQNFILFNKNVRIEFV